jgi:WD40 repeat protein
LTLRGHTGEVVAIAYSRNGRWIATGSTDGTARTWDAADGRLVLTLEAGPQPVDAVAFSPDGDMLATTSADGSVRIWNITPGGSRDWLTIAAHPGGVQTLWYADEDTRLASTGFTDGRQKLWDPRTGALVGTSTAPVAGLSSVTTLNRSFTTAGATSPDGATVAATTEGAATLYDASGRPLVQLAPTHGGVQAVAFDPLGRRVAVGNRDGTVVIYDVATHRPEASAHDGQGVVEAVAFGPDGSTLATGGLDTTAKLWDVGTGSEIVTLTGHTNALSALAFDPSGTRLATGSLDGTIRVYVLPISELVKVAQERLTRSWTRGECMRYLGGRCPKSPERFSDATRRQPARSASRSPTSDAHSAELAEPARARPSLLELRTDIS